MYSKSKWALLHGAVGALTVLGAVTAMAAPAWAASPAPHASGCNGKVCISVTGRSDSWRAEGYTESGEEFYGHMQLLLPSNSHPNGPDGLNPRISIYQEESYGKVCVIGWKKVRDNYYVSAGEPCVFVY